MSRVEKKAISELLSKGVNTINEHIKIFMQKANLKKIELFGKNE